MRGFRGQWEGTFHIGLVEREHGGGAGGGAPGAQSFSKFGKVFLRKLQLLHYTGRITQLARRFLKKFRKILINIQWPN